MSAAFFDEEAIARALDILGEIIPERGMPVHQAAADMKPFFPAEDYRSSPFVVWQVALPIRPFSLAPP